MSDYMTHTAKKKSQAGFTLVELSIVLVIIGLIVGGVLVGQNLIRAAELRATVSQIETFNTTVNTFRGKYNGIPGDFVRAAQFALGTNGDGNGLVEDADADATTLTAHDGEMPQFWVHLSASGMVGEIYADAGAGNATVPQTNFPLSKHGVGGIIITAFEGYNRYLIGANAAADDDMDNLVQSTLRPEDAYSLDTKLDNGVPFTGTALSIIYDGTTAVHFAYPAAAGVEDSATAVADSTFCVFGDTTGGLDPAVTADRASFQYNAASTAISCTLLVRAN